MNNQYKSVPVKSSEITSYSEYLSRRDFLKAAGIVTGSAILAACSPGVSAAPTEEITELPAKIDERGDPANSYRDITNYNNFYEFSTDKEAVNYLSQEFTTEPWTVEVSGLVNNPKTYGIEDLLKFPQEERVYRLRCVEAWSMVIPWTGFPLASLLKEVEPNSDAKFVRFETVYRPEEMPGLRSPFYPWPYQEGLRLDEAMHDLTILATGLYGMPMPNPNGAPIRLVVPWKYGFKSIKSIVKIELVAEQPSTLWNSIGANEYGFYSNVNPDRPHPRWSQASERRIGELGRRPTLMFNGYAEEVASLYEGMDLIENY
ncbi:MAG TPA: protein-methionine-sulfoxide reductase catalytic subunit MsrP [Anaerolineales bacterium]|jgi:sulfoxide reductase catalytic subunit YedY|nr:protein-methionine-sulfoxide reductase catalytic subunit MsrP [Anaerolineales bacterium]